MNTLIRSPDEGSDQEHDESTWAISYGDMITLLLGFFVLFFTLEPPKKAEEKMMDSLVKTLSDGGAAVIEYAGGRPGSVDQSLSAAGLVAVRQEDKQLHLPDQTQELKGIEQDPKLEPEDIAKLEGLEHHLVVGKHNLHRLYGRILKFFPKPDEPTQLAEQSSGDKTPTAPAVSRVKIPAPDLNVHKFGDQLVIQFPGVSFFDTAQTELTPEGRKALEKFISVYRPYAGKSIVNIIGYTDKRPVRARYRFHDNLELSMLRALTVQRYIQRLGIPLRNSRLAGHGIFRDGFKMEPRNEQEALAFSRRAVLVIEPLE